MFDAGTVAVLAPFLMVVGIVWVQSRAKLEEKRIAADAARRPDAERIRDAERIEELEERVRILERIVTDRGYELAQKIEALRDDRTAGTRIGDPVQREQI
jgi:hypothetical protein